MSHRFKEKTFKNLTNCHQCKQLIWGIRKQGYKCKGCKYICHLKCKDLVPVCPRTLSKGFLSNDEDEDDEDYVEDETIDISNSRAEKYARSLSRRLSISTIHYNTVEEAVEPSTLDQIRTIIKSDKLRQIIIDAASEGNNVKPAQITPGNQPPLNPQLTIKNFSRFVSRCGPIFFVRNYITAVLTWENPITSAIALIIYCAICLYPKLLFFIPQASIICLLVSNYPTTPQEELELANKKKKSAQKKPKPLKIKTDLEPSKSDTIKKLTSPPISPTTMTPSLLQLAYTTLFQPSSDESPEYHINFQNIQNMMGDFSDMHDHVTTHLFYIDWSDKELTMHILQTTLIASILSTVVLCMVPTRTLFLSIGISAFSMNTRFARYLTQELSPFLMQLGNKKAKTLTKWYKDFDRKLETEEETKEISVYQNQRWRSGRGYEDQMEKNDRSEWSDFNGVIKMPFIEAIPAPKGYKWKDPKGWMLDNTGPWYDSLLGLGKI